MFRFIAFMCKRRARYDDHNADEKVCDETTLSRYFLDEKKAERLFLRQEVFYQVLQ